MTERTVALPRSLASIAVAPSITRPSPRGTR